MAASEGASSHPEHEERPRMHQVSSDVKHDSEPNNYISSFDMMTDPESRPIDGLGDFDGFHAEHDDEVMNAEGASQDDDFGPLEMFDSNATQPPYSSQANFMRVERENTKAPEAAMTAEATATQMKKSKREKKKKHILEDAPLQPSNEQEAPRKHKKSKKKSVLPTEIPDSLPADQTPSGAETQLPTPGLTAGLYAYDADVVPSTQSKRKRKSSDGAEAKQRKKRKSQDLVMEASSQDVIAGTQDDDTLTATIQPASPNAQASAIFEDSAVDSDPQKSPSVARLRRRSQSREARTRENSVAPATNGDSMDVDTPMANTRQEAVGDKDIGTDNHSLQPPKTAEAAGTVRDVETLAREAWNEHVNGRSRPENIEDPAPAQQAQDGELYNAPKSVTREPELPSATPKRPRSTRKKAKPTYFENQDGFNELPSPSAMTPKPRSRAKRATRKKKAEPAARLSQQMNSVDDEDTDHAASGYRNRMRNYTQGRFSDEEIGRIARVIETFRAENDMPQFDINQMLHAPGGTAAGETHAILWNRIFAECPDRHRQKIINITRKKFHNFVARATWTVEQDGELRDLIEVHGTKWSQIAGIINRHPEDVRDRYRNYIVCGENQRKDSWDEDEEGRLAQFVIEAMEAIDELRQHQPTRALLKKPYEELIDWQNISERMGRTRSRLQCITKWKAMNLKTHGKDKLVSQEPNAQISFRLEKARRQISDMPEEERFRLLMAVQASGATSETKLSWQKLLDKQFRSTWHRSTQMLLWRRLKHTVPGWEKMAIRDCAQYLMDQYNQTGSLPEIKDEDYSDTQEMDFLRNIPTSVAANSNPGPRKDSVSEEYIIDSDVEGDAQMQDIEMQGFEGVSEPIPQQMPEDVVDPALSALEPSTSTNPAPSKKSRAKKGGRRSKKALEPSQDPIEDVDIQFLSQEAEVRENSEIDEEQYRKKKTPSKFRHAGSNMETSPQDPPSDSVMDDMEDLPARVPA